MFTCMVQDIITDHFLYSPPFCYLMSHDASWGIVAKLGTRAIQHRRLHAHAMYGCWIMHEITLIGWPVTCGRGYLPITSACGTTVPTVILMLLSNAQILRRGNAAAAGGWSRSEDTLEECNRARVLSLSVPGWTCSRPMLFCSMCYEQLSLSHRPSLQSLTSVVVDEMLSRSETYPRRLVSSRCSIGGWKLFTSHFLTDAKPLLSMQY